MDRTAKEAQVWGIFQEISHGYDRANTRISLGLHWRWKRMMTSRLIKHLPADRKCWTYAAARETSRWRLLGSGRMYR